jgi:hypothetical protein
MAGEGGSRGMLLLVDEAHALPLRLLEEIRLLSNLVRGGQPLVRLVLAGGPVLEERFASPKLDSFSQRLSARCYLEALNRSETQEYIQSQINAVGGRGDQVFSQETCQGVFQATGGVPRLINQVCDHALLLVYVAGRQRIEPTDIEEAWGDLQQLPTPWNGESKAADSTGGGVIEFGSLDDHAEAAPATAADAEAATPALWLGSTEEEPEGEPSQQIHRIEQLLAEADDFQPAGSIGPETELCFEETEHPFQEEFEHEEVVVDRYAAAVVKPAMQPADQSAASSPEPQPVEEAASAACETPAPAALQAEPELELVAACAHASDHGPPEAEPKRGASPPAPPAPGPPSPGPPAHRREYRQLFSQLRRG